MNTFAHQILFPVPQALPSSLDWLELEWGGPYDEEEEPLAPCGWASCPGDCEVCAVCVSIFTSLFLPIEGPLNRDGIPLGYLRVTE